MASTMKNLIGTEIRKSQDGGYLDLNLRWRETGTHWRRIQAETYRIAASICECSEHARWCVDPHADCGCLGGDTLGTYIRLELAEGSETEMALAEILVRQLVAGFQA
jgi:hypothetical protein